VLSAPGQLAHGLEVLFELHRRRWALAGGSDGIRDAALEAFHRAAAGGLGARGWARLFVLQVEGAPRAILYGFHLTDRLAFYQSGHDPDWRVRSVGSVLLGLILQWCFAAGIAEFDFLHGDEPYKLAWANGSRHTVRLRARARGVRPWLRERGRVGEATLRSLAKRILPRRSVQWLRALRS
jgi:CelD/BcsL family acetyltransferase involved in cellulose biosynthesis